MGTKHLIVKLKNKKYRDAYVTEHARTGIAYQLRAMRDSRGWTLGTASKLEDPDYGKVTLQTLLEIASAFDVALLVKFVPFSRLLNEFRDVSPEALSVESFSDDTGLGESV